MIDTFEIKDIDDENVLLWWLLTIIMHMCTFALINTKIPQCFSHAFAMYIESTIGLQVAML